jgi:hypothetical protein
MQTIDPAEFEKRIKRITAIFSQIVEHSDKQALVRCPYKNRFSQCTAKFGCRYKRPPGADSELPICTSDDQLDYRTAWESTPESVDTMRAQLRTGSCG